MVLRRSNTNEMMSFMNKLLLRSNSSSSFTAKKYLHSSLIRFVAQIIDGKEMARKIIAETKQEVHEWIDGGHKRPALALVKVGIPESEGKYTKSVLRACKDIGIEVKKFELPKDIREVELLADIRKLNDDLAVDAIMLEFPLPQHITERIMCNAVAPHKDVNGFNIVNVGRLTQQMTTIVPCMAAAIKEIIVRIGEHRKFS
ncbi:hypothetical protein C0J52_22160 [Blattella germanica]|nr:hypothetical protein C0J52_22160 [Blattella germanica]